MLISPYAPQWLSLQSFYCRVKKEHNFPKIEKTPLVSTEAIAHEKSMWQALKRLSYWFFIDSDQSIYQWMQKERQKHRESGCGCTATVMDYWEGNVQNVLCRVCALHIKDSAQENGSCQHLQTYSKKMQSSCIKNKILEREKKKKLLTLSFEHHRMMKKHLCTHTQHILIHSHLCISIFPLRVCDKVNKKDNSSLQLSPPACSSDSGLLWSATIPWGSWIIHLRGVTQPTALFLIA